MPGVPSGRGCDACRQQKKKCDQAQPSCSRCSRLQISCIGAGQRRYIFHQQMVVEQAKPQGSTIVVTTREKETENIPLSIARSLSNETTVMASSLVSALSVTDLRYDLTYFGEFLKGLPPRLGTSPALDASVKALTIAHRALTTRQQSLEAIEAYGQALHALSKSLGGERDRSQTVNTLCAMYLVMICQGWIGKREDHCLSHGEAIVYMLGDAVERDWRGSFEKEMLASLCVIMMVESFENPHLRIDSILRTLTQVYGPSRPSSVVTLVRLCKIPVYLRNPELYFFDIQSLYQDIVTDSATIRSQLALLISSFSAPGATPIAGLKQHSRGQAYLGFLLVFGIMLNTILRAFDPFNLLLVEENLAFCAEVISIAESAALYRPLSAAYVPLCLAAVWAADIDKVMTMEAERLLADYQEDFADYSDKYWMDMACWLRRRFELIRQKLEFLAFQSRDSAGGEGSACEMSSGGCEVSCVPIEGPSCCVM